MPVKIRLQRKGRKKKPFYHIVIADARAKRDGRMIERIGSYNPLTVPATIQIDRERAFHWLMEGAQPTNTVKAIMRYNGIYYRKHLMRGVAKGAMTEAQAMEKYNAWIAEKEAAIAKEVAKTAEKTKAYHKMIDGVAPAKKKATVVVEAGKSTADAPKSLLESIEKTEIDTTSGEMVTKTEEPKEEVKTEPKKVEAKVEAPKVEVKAEEPKVEVKVEAPAPVEVKAEEPKVEVKVEAPAPVEVKAEEPKVEVKVEAPAPVEVKAEEPKVVRVEATPVEKVESPFKQDDLTAIEGVGPKIAEKLTEDGINTWEKLAKADVDAIKAILVKAGSRYSMHNPTTWPQQAQLCVEAKWDVLKELQDRLDGGVDKG